MSKDKSREKYRVADFTVVGQLLDFIIKDGYKIKYLRMAIAEREYWIKLPKELRNTLDPNIVPGAWLEVSGTQKLKSAGMLKLEATSVDLAREQSPSALEEVAEPQSSPKVSPKTSAKNGKASVLVCQKSSCRKRGVAQVCRALEQGLRDRGLSDRVQIKMTGCLKQCKQGPNVVIMPDKTRYSSVNYTQALELIEQHFVPRD